MRAGTGWVASWQRGMGKLPNAEAHTAFGNRSGIDAQAQLAGAVFRQCTLQLNPPVGSGRRRAPPQVWILGINHGP